jgi:hypothetical protein
MKVLSNFLKQRSDRSGFLRGEPLIQTIITRNRFKVLTSRTLFDTIFDSIGPAISLPTNHVILVRSIATRKKDLSITELCLTESHMHGSCQIRLFSVCELKSRPGLSPTNIRFQSRYHCDLESTTLRSEISEQHIVTFSYFKSTNKGHVLTPDSVFKAFFPFKRFGRSESIGLSSI